VAFSFDDCAFTVLSNQGTINVVAGSKMAQLDGSELLREVLSTEGPDYGLKLSAKILEELVQYYELLEEWNARLHLVAPCSAKEFARRHLLESLFMTRFLSHGASGIDVGSGAGLPMIPCLIVRRDLKATLVEASQKKSVFLREALKQANLGDSATVLDERFEALPEIAADFVSCRALDKFESQLPELVKWSPREATLFFFGGPSLRAKLQGMHLDFREESLPKSDRRFLFIVSRD